jgi:hypothetical protein
MSEPVPTPLEYQSPNLDVTPPPTWRIVVGVILMMLTALIVLMMFVMLASITYLLFIGEDAKPLVVVGSGLLVTLMFGFSATTVYGMARRQFKPRPRV